MAGIAAPPSASSAAANHGSGSTEVIQARGPSR
jgi:hypothetical protein